MKSLKILFALIPILSLAAPVFTQPIATFPKSIIASGEEGTIHVEFNSKNKTGIQTKKIPVTGNFEENINRVLRIRGQVLPAQE